MFKYESFSRFAEKGGTENDYIWENNFTVAE
jgi:hypothetical protein